MGYTNSPLVTYTKISPNRTSPRNHVIDTITIHCYVGQVKVEDMCAWLSNPSAQASANYCIGKDGRVGLNVEERDRSWCSSSRDNDNRAITIECASDRVHPYAINDAVYASLIKLVADICKRNGIKKLLWRNDKNLIGKVELQNITLHRWFANKACPGDFIVNRLDRITTEVNQLIGASNPNPSPVVENKTQAAAFNGLSEPQRAEKMLEMIRRCDDSGILFSVTTAQMILESGYVSTDLAQNANNCFGMKCTLSGNTWKTVWDGHSKYTKKTAEQDKAGNQYYVWADFRKYPCIEDSIKDHSLYLLGAMNGSKLRYSGLLNCKTYREQIQLIKNGGYATDVNYVSKICNIIERYNLARYDSEAGKGGSVKPTPDTPVTPDVSPVSATYIVQAGAYEKKANATKALKAVQKIVPDAFITQENDKIYRIQAGAFSVKANAQRRVKQLQDNGIAAIIK